MNIVTATQISTGARITKRVPSLELAKTFTAAFRTHADYSDVVLHENTSTVPAAAPAPAPTTPATTEQTGRVGNGLHVHKLAAGSSVCGASFRRGFRTSRPVYVTGEQVTCGHCR